MYCINDEMYYLGEYCIVKFTKENGAEIVADFKNNKEEFEKVKQLWREFNEKNSKD